MIKAEGKDVVLRLCMVRLRMPEAEARRKYKAFFQQFEDGKMSREHFEQLCSESLDGKLVNELDLPSEQRLAWMVETIFEEGKDLRRQEVEQMLESTLMLEYGDPLLAARVREEISLPHLVERASLLRKLKRCRTLKKHYEKIIQQNM